MPNPKRKPTLLSPDDFHLFNEGRHHRLYEKIGAHIGRAGRRNGTYFSVWAPNAKSVSVIGSFNDWDPIANSLEPQMSSGIWEGFIPKVAEGDLYKFHVVSHHEGYVADKADPFGFGHEIAPLTASIVRDLSYEWSDASWMQSRRSKNSLASPISVYEVHLGSWAREPGDGNRSLTYLEMAEKLIPYVKEQGFTHVEFMPVMEHPFFGSWGYQTTGYFAPTSRYGSPTEFMALINQFHQEGIGVYLDWVPSHFPNDEYGLALMDGTHLFDHADPRQGIHPDWDSCIFNYARGEVRSFLISNALFWLDRYHVDGLRVDAVASMLYLDYSRREGEWIPNTHGGRENLDAIDFLRELNVAVYQEFPDVQTIAEESTSWPMVSRPTNVGGLGFGMKWDMGWMHDSLEYFKLDPLHRKHHQGELTFRQVYAYSENFMLPLSHDEVVHGKGSLLGKMPGDERQRFANLRLLLGYQFALPGKKLLFMGSEFAQLAEWNHDGQLDWGLLAEPLHAGISAWVKALNHAYRSESALHELDTAVEGFDWISTEDTENSVVAFTRMAESNDDLLLVVCNFTPVERREYHLGVPRAGKWTEIANSDARMFGGSGQGNDGVASTFKHGANGYEHSLSLTLPPLGMLILKAARS